MKKMRILCVSVLALGLAFIATSCKKDKQTTMSFTVGTCAMEEEDEDSRVYLDFGDANKMKWSANDRIMVYNLVPGDGDAAIIQEFHTDRNAEGETYANFYGPSVGAPQTDNGYYFFYPAQMVDQSYFDVDNRAKFVVADTVRYTELNNKKGTRITTIQPNTMAQATQSNTLDFLMQNIFGVARIYMTGNKTVVKVELEDRALALTGSAKVRLTDLDPQHLQDLIADFKAGNIDYVDCYHYAVENLLYAPTPTGNVITMDCAHTYNGEFLEGVTLTNPDPKSFMFALRPGALCNGFIVRVYFSDHTGSIIEVKGEDLANPRKYTIVPNRIQAIRFQDYTYYPNLFPLDVDDPNNFPQFTW